MKFKKWMLLLISFSFISCENFLNGSLLKEELEKEINYAQSSAVSVVVIAEEGTGTIVTGADEHQIKVSDHFDIVFRKAAGYTFVRWAAFSKTNKTKELTDNVQFSPVDSVSTTVTLLSGDEDLEIRPICEPSLSLIESYPVDDALGKPKDSAIKLVSNYKLSRNNDLSKIEISISNSDVDGRNYFNAPVFIDDNIIYFLPKENNKFNVTDGEIRKITVSLPLNFEYLVDGKKKFTNEIISYSYRVNSETCNKVNIVGYSPYGSYAFNINGRYSLGSGSNLGFTENPDYQFIRWQIWDESKTEDGEIENSKYIYIENPNSKSTSFTLLNTPDNEEDISFVIRPVCEKRPKVVSATPIYDTAGVLRDRTIVVMFDKPMSLTSIYWTEQEISDLLGSSYQNQYNLLPQEGKFINDIKYYYGYVNKNDENDVYFKNIEIVELTNPNNNLLKYYEEPEFDIGNTRTLRIKTKSKIVNGKKEADAPGAAMEILVTIGNEFCNTLDGNDITLSNEYSWVYYTNNSTDCDGPVFTTDAIHITLADDNQTEYSNSKPDLDKSGYSDKNEIENYNVKNGKLWIKAEISDAGSGPARMTSIIKQIVDACTVYPLSDSPSVKTQNLKTEILGQKGNASQLIDISDLNEGFYEAYIIGYDKNDQETQSEKFYFVYDKVAPKVKSNFTFNTNAIDKITITSVQNSDVQNKKIEIQNIDCTNTTGTPICNLGSDSRKHNLKITEYDYAGNSIEYYKEIYTVPEVGMIYYSDGYWADKDNYDNSKTPEGVICNVASPSKFYIWDIWDQYGYCWGSADLWVVTDVDSKGLDIYNNLIKQFGKEKILESRGMSRQNYSMNVYTDTLPRSPSIWSYAIQKNDETVPANVKSEQWFIPGRSEFTFVFDNMAKMNDSYETITKTGNYGHSSIEAVTNNKTETAKKTRILRRVNLLAIDNGAYYSGQYWTCNLHWNINDRKILGSPSEVSKIYYDANVLQARGMYYVKTQTINNTPYYLYHSALDNWAVTGWFYMDRSLRYSGDYATSDSISFEMYTHAMALVALKE